MQCMRIFVWSIFRFATRRDPMPVSTANRRSQGHFDALQPRSVTRIDGCSVPVPLEADCDTDTDSELRFLWSGEILWQSQELKKPGFQARRAKEATRMNSAEQF